jgi:hypothetical protein
MMIIYVLIIITQRAPDRLMHQPAPLHSTHSHVYDEDNYSSKNSAISYISIIQLSKAESSQVARQHS